ncbi:glycoside hydrolase family 130 protein [soil metagenome]
MPIELGVHPDVPVRRLPVYLHSDDRRVIVRQFAAAPQRVQRVFDGISKMPEDQISKIMEWVESAYQHRHRALPAALLEHYEIGSKLINWHPDWSGERRLLAGAYLTMEYSIESAALFNPSVCLHPNQSGVPAGAVRFIMSLRATGEGHVSSIVFRTGIITPDDSVTLEALPSRLHRSQMSPDRRYLKPTFTKKLHEMGIVGTFVDRVMSQLGDRFTLQELTTLAQVIDIGSENPMRAESFLRTIIWLAESNYHIELAPDARLDELVIFPMSSEDSHGMEDLRMTRFVDDDQTVSYYGTYTAYNGVRTLPMLLETSDFRRIEFHSLNGATALNKGMALFPRRINGLYTMCSRIDGESLYIAQSQSVYFWETAKLLIAPKHPWELMQIGNCGAPMETPRGWLLLTHGVGPMRTYAIGAMVLDLEDPTKVIGHLRHPLLTPTDGEREGYVPNVVYTCGSIIHGDDLFIPFALADTSTSLAVVNVEALIDQAIKDLNA